MTGVVSRHYSDIKYATHSNYISYKGGPMSVDLLQHKTSIRNVS